MSRSRRKVPIFGHTTARSEADDKRLWHKRWRSRERDQLASLSPESDPLPVQRQAVSSTWDMCQGREALVRSASPARYGGTYRGPSQPVEAGAQGIAGSTFGKVAG